MNTYCYMYTVIEWGGTMPVPVVCTDSLLEAKETFDKVLRDEIRTLAKQVVAYRIPLGVVVLAGEMNTRIPPGGWGPFLQLACATRDNPESAWKPNSTTCWDLAETK